MIRGNGNWKADLKNEDYLKVWIFLGFILQNFL